MRWCTGAYDILFPRAASQPAKGCLWSARRKRKAAWLLHIGSGTSSSGTGGSTRICHRGDEGHRRGRGAVADRRHAPSTIYSPGMMPVAVHVCAPLVLPDPNPYPPILPPSYWQWREATVRPAVREMARIAQNSAGPRLIRVGGGGDSNHTSPPQIVLSPRRGGAPVVLPRIGVRRNIAQASQGAVATKRLTRSAGRDWRQGDCSGRSRTHRRPR